MGFTINLNIISCNSKIKIYHFHWSYFLMLIASFQKRCSFQNMRTCRETRLKTGRGIYFFFFWIFWPGRARYKQMPADGKVYYILFELQTRNRKSHVHLVAIVTLLLSPQKPHWTPWDLLFVAFPTRLQLSQCPRKSLFAWAVSLRTKTNSKSLAKLNLELFLASM